MLPSLPLPRLLPEHGLGGEEVMVTDEPLVQVVQSYAREPGVRSLGRQRLSRLTSLCHALARPFTEFYSAAAPFDWYRTY